MLPAPAMAASFPACTSQRASSLSRPARRASPFGRSARAGRSPRWAAPLEEDAALTRPRPAPPGRRRRAVVLAAPRCERRPRRGHGHARAMRARSSSSSCLADAGRRCGATGPPRLPAAGLDEAATRRAMIDVRRDHRARRGVRQDRRARPARRDRAAGRYPNWVSIARDGASDGARRGTSTRAKAACRGCHTQYRDVYHRTERRARCPLAPPAPPVDERRGRAPTKRPLRAHSRAREVARPEARPPAGQVHAAPPARSPSRRARGATRRGCRSPRSPSVLHVTTALGAALPRLPQARTPIESVPASPGRENVWRIKPSERARSVPLRRAPAYCLVAARGRLRAAEGLGALRRARPRAPPGARRSRAARRAGPRRGRFAGDTRLDERFFVRRAARETTPAAGRGDRRPLPRRRRPARGPVPLPATGARARPRSSASSPTRTRSSSTAARLVSSRSTSTRARCAPSRSSAIADLCLAREERFTLPAELRASDFAHGAFGVARGAAAVRVLVEFDARVADEIRARKLHPAQKIATSHRTDACASRSTLPGRAPRRGRRWVLGFADAARVIEPPELVAEVAARAGRGREALRLKH